MNLGQNETMNKPGGAECLSGQNSLRPKTGAYRQNERVRAALD